MENPHSVSDIVCDLILLSWNQLDETRACINTLFTATRVPCRLIIVDNASESNVREYLSSIKPAGAISDVIYLQNEKNEGFPRGMNRGIKASTARYVCLLNNDLKFTQGWLQELIDVLDKYPQIGLLNPTSNTLGIHPDTGSSIDTHAQVLSKMHHQYVEASKCSGFCLLIKREVIDRIGILSEEVDRFFFEDEDYSMRVQEAGFQCAAALGSYVYHKEHTSVNKVPEREAIFRRNQQWCYKKWGRWLRIAWPRFSHLKPGSSELRQWLEELLVWARRRSYVYVYAPLPKSFDSNQLFHSVGLIPHTGIYWKPLPQRAIRWAAIGAILKRQKKPFDMILSPDHKWASRMRIFGWLHRARIVDDYESCNIDALIQQARE